MTTKFYVDAQGKYLGGFDGPPILDKNGAPTGETQDAPVPSGGILVPHAPDDAGQTWDGEKFLPMTY
jgi:hypothetical protein